MIATDCNQSGSFSCIKTQLTTCVRFVQMPSHTSHPLPFPCIGTQRTLDVFTYGHPHAARCVYIQAALHADELPGATPHMQQQVNAHVILCRRHARRVRAAPQAAAAGAQVRASGAERPGCRLSPLIAWQTADICSQKSSSCPLQTPLGWARCCRPAISAVSTSARGRTSTGALRTLPATSTSPRSSQARSQLPARIHNRIPV